MKNQTLTISLLFVSVFWVIQIIPHFALIVNQNASFFSRLSVAQASAPVPIADSSGMSDRERALLMRAQTLNDRGRDRLSAGDAAAALATWEAAEAAYREAGDLEGAIGTRINQAQALQALGMYRRALNRLTEIHQTLQSQINSPLKVASLLSLGKALRRVGDLEQSQQVLQQSLAIARQLNLAEFVSESAIASGNTARDRQDFEAAIDFYQQAANFAPSVEAKVQAELNQLSLFIEIERESEARDLLPEIESKLSELSPSHTSVFARINFAESLMKMAAGSELKRESSDRTFTLTPPSLNAQNISQILAVAIQEARQIEDVRGESYALGKLGQLYERSTQLSEAVELTQNALIRAEAINASDIAYRWQWQLGRMLSAQGNKQQAIAAYRAAVETLESLRSDLVAIDRDVQFSFRESAAPVYRQLVALLLDSQPTQQDLILARETIELLQLAELDNFFRDACLDTQPVQIDQIDRQAAVIYPIILEDRLAVILSLPGQPLSHYTSAASQTEVERTLTDLRQSLSPLASKNERLRLSEAVYNWLIRPAEVDLANSAVETLVFVPDGGFGNIPLATIYDGEKYLMEQYAIAITPGLHLLDPQPLPRSKLNALTGGLSEARQGFSALPGVEFELNRIQSELPTEVLLNQQFTKQQLKSSLENAPFPVVHLATHGQFSSKAEDTFILTWDGRINVKELDELLQTTDTRNRPPIELLVFSACETATGDNRAALGLAGVAVRSGARTTLATLWSVKDEATAFLMAEFYRELLQPGVTKAQALRRAQLTLFQDRRYQHPFYWAPFVLVGNWL